MDALLFIRALRARFRLFALAVGATLATALALSVIMSPTYRATASLVVDARQEQSLSSVLEVLSAPTERLAYLQTQVDIITSPTVARRVVDALDLASDPKLIEAHASRAGESTSIEDWIAAALLENLDVETTQSSVIHLTYVGDQAENAARTANAFAAAFMDTMLELRVEPTRQAAEWFDRQLTTLRADLQEAQAQMTAFQQEHGIVSVDERLDDKYAAFEDLASQLLRAQERAIESDIAAGAAGRAMARGDELDDLPAILENSYLRELDTALLESEAELRALATQYGDNHPEYESQVAEIAARRAQRDHEVRKVLASADLGAEQSSERIDEIESLLTSRRDELLDLKSSRDTLAVLKGNVDTAQGAYDTAMQRYVVSQVDSRASHANVAMLSPAITPSKPYRPNLMLNLALAFGFGSMLGGSLVALAELSDRRIRSPADLRDSTTMPMLGMLSGFEPSRPALLPHIRSDDDTE